MKKQLLGAFYVLILLFFHIHDTSGSGTGMDTDYAADHLCGDVTYIITSSHRVCAPEGDFV